MCHDGITCIGLAALGWPFAALAAIGGFYLRQFVKWWNQR